MAGNIRTGILTIFVSVFLATSFAYSEETVEQDAENTEKIEDSSPKLDTTESESFAKPPEVLRDLSLLPFPTKRMHELILEATQTGDIEKLRPLIGVGESSTQLSLGGYDGDPIDFLKSQSGDKDGHEIMAILEEVLQAGFVHLDSGTEHELYVWPYFFAYPIDELAPSQRVELFRIVTYGDFQDMQDFGGYIFYRVGISPTGRWHFFVAGD